MTKSKILVGVCSCLQHVAKRDAIRETWGKDIPPDTHLVYFVGRGVPVDEVRVLTVDAPDTYETLPQKMQAFFQLALKTDFEWLFKCDDDTYVSLNRLRLLVDRAEDPNRMRIVKGRDTPMVRGPAEFVGAVGLQDHGFRTASGGAGYLLSRRLVQMLADTVWPETGAEDVFVSQVVIDSGALYSADHRLQWWDTIYPEPDNDVVSAHYVSPEAMRQIHAADAPYGTILSHGQWAGPVDDMHIHDATLSTAIAVLCIREGIKSAWDFGCGKGDYARELRGYGCHTVGVDGHPRTQEISAGLGLVGNLAQDLCLPRADVVLSLEVGEHIPAEFAPIYIWNLGNHAVKMVIVSWGVPGQGGHGHVNCQPNDWVITSMGAYGFKINWEHTGKLREAATLHWFKNTLMVFTR